jgi:hypothetical protein
VNQEQQRTGQKELKPLSFQNQGRKPRPYDRFGLNGQFLPQLFIVASIQWISFSELQIGGDFPQALSLQALYFDTESTYEYRNTQFQI